MMEVFYLIAFLLLPLRMKQLINNGRMKFPPYNGPTNAGHHYPSAPSLITPGGGDGEGGILERSWKVFEKNSAKKSETRSGVFGSPEGGRRERRGATAEVRKKGAAAERRNLLILRLQLIWH